MNKDIEIMIRLQAFRDRVLAAEKNIQSWEKSIADMTERVRSCTDAVDASEQDIKSVKNMLKQEELVLADMEQKAEKLRERKIIVQNEKELAAVTHEMDLIEEQKGESEEKIILMMDDLDEKENRGLALADELKDARDSAEAKTAELNEKIKGSERVIKENSAKYEENLPGLSRSVVSRFDKLIKSKDGKAIGDIKGEVCSCCNFQVPSHLVAEASADDRIAVCTNCGRFIYAIK